MIDMAKRGTLIVIDGVDGSGKNTQAKLLKKSLTDIISDRPIELVSFPRYGTPGCTMVEKYLNGEFGNNADSVDAYTASMMFMIDRSISYKTEPWREVYRNGGIVISDRYFTSNMIHQGAKFDVDTILGTSKFEEFARWATYTELNAIQLPKPDIVFWLEVSKESNEKLLAKRSKNNKSHTTDIHEINLKYLDRCREVMKLYKNYQDSITYIAGDLEHKNKLKILTINVDDRNHKLYGKKTVNERITERVNLLLEDYAK